MLVVIGIIVFLAAITIPVVLRAYNAGEKAKARADLQAIGIALEAYRADFGDYPRGNDAWVAGRAYAVGDLVTYAPVGQRITQWRCTTAHTSTAATPPPASGESGGNWDAAWTDTNPDPMYGRELPATPPSTRLLGRALLGTAQQQWAIGVSYVVGDMVAIASGAFYRCTSAHTSAAGNSPTSGGAPWAVSTPVTSGLGFRPRPQGRVYGPYLQLDRFRTSSNPSQPVQDRFEGDGLFDRNGRPILYMPANPARPNTNVAGGYLANSGAALYDTTGTVEAFKRPCPPNINHYVNYGCNDAGGISRMQVMAGDLNANGMIDGTDSALASGSYVLWMAGPDRFFGPNTANVTEAKNCDDVTNFR